MSSFNFADLPEEPTIDLLKELVSYICASECTSDDVEYIQARYEKMLDSLTKMCTHSEKFSKFVLADPKAEKFSKCVVADQRAEKKTAYDLSYIQTIYEKMMNALTNMCSSRKISAS
jgi:hypothetical protein